MMFYSRAVVAAWLLVFPIANNYSQTGREFWFVAPEVASEHGDLPIIVRLSSFEQEVVVTLSMPANLFFKPIVVEMDSNSTQSIDLSPYFESIENRPANQVLNRGILIKSNGPITSYYEVSNFFNPEIFPMKGANALGTEFFIPGQNLFRNEEGSAAIDIVATEDNTQITITPTNEIVGHPAGVPFNVTLNRGETYSARATGTDPEDKLGGTRVESDKPIAVTYSDDSIRNGDYWDLVGDQVVPIEIVGTEYIAIAGFAFEESVFVMGTQDDTDIFVNGGAIPFGNVSAGTILRIGITEASVYIKANKPVYAYQITGHLGEIGDALLPQITCTGSPQVGFVRPSDNVFALMLLTRSENVDHFKLNGKDFVATGNFLPVPGTDGEWVASLNPFSVNQVPLGPNLIQNTQGFFHLGILYMIGPSSVYGYFSNYNTFKGETVTLCPGGKTNLDPGPQFDSYLWDNGLTAQIRPIDQEGTYQVDLVFNQCTATSTYNVFFEPTEVHLGPDTAVCDGETVILEAGSFETFRWERVMDSAFTSDLPGIMSNQTDTYLVTATNRCGIFKDSIALSFEPKPVFDLGPNQTICDEGEKLLGAPPGMDEYLWQDGSTNPDLLARNDGRYRVEIRKGPCRVRDSIDLMFRVSPPAFSLGANDTICVDEPRVLAVLDPLFETFLWHDGSTDRQVEVFGGGTYWVEASNACAQFRAEIILEEIQPEDRFIPNIFTPNGDFINELFEIDPWLVGSRLIVLNRWGRTVYLSPNYRNDWNGRNLSPGIYYYQITSTCLKSEFKGWVEIRQ